MTHLIGVVLTRVDAAAEFALGTVYTHFNGNKYKYVTYSEEAAALDGVAGEVCYYVADNGIMADDVTSDLSASDEIGAGVLQAIMSDNEFGWIQISGPATLTIALTGGADGDPLTPTGTTDGALDVSALVTDNICAIAGDITAKEIYCNFPQ